MDVIRSMISYTMIFASLRLFHGVQGLEITEVHHVGHLLPVAQQHIGAAQQHVGPPLGRDAERQRREALGRPLLQGHVERQGERRGLQVAAAVPQGVAHVEALQQRQRRGAGGGQAAERREVRLGAGGQQAQAARVEVEGGDREQHWEGGP